MRIRVKSRSLSEIYQLLETVRFRPLYAVSVTTVSRIYKFEFVIVDNPNAFTLEEISYYKILVKGED